MLRFAESPTQAQGLANGSYWFMGSAGADCHQTCSAHGGCTEGSFSGFPNDIGTMNEILSSVGLDSSSCSRVKQGRTTFPSNPLFSELGGVCYHGGLSVCLSGYCIELYPQTADVAKQVAMGLVTRQTTAIAASAHASVCIHRQDRKLPHPQCNSLSQRCASVRMKSIDLCTLWRRRRRTCKDTRVLARTHAHTHSQALTHSTKWYCA